MMYEYPKSGFGVKWDQRYSCALLQRSSVSVKEHIGLNLFVTGCVVAFVFLTEFVITLNLNFKKVRPEERLDL